MDPLYRCCAGLDVHKRTVVACLLRTAADGRPNKELRSFGTMTDDLLALADWLGTAGCEAVAMESTGVFWKPVYNLLEGQLATVMVVNAQHIRAVPGRKTDLKDAEWIAELLQHGLLRPSFIPDRPQRELRELTRYRTTLVRERAAEVNRIQKVLEGANIKLAGVASNILGVSGRAMLRAIIEGETDPAALAELARGRMRPKIPQLRKALTGRFRDHHAFLLRSMLDHVDRLDADIAALDQRIEAALAPFAVRVELLRSIPGVDVRCAEVIVAEVGADMSVFPTPSHLASWAGMCPGQRDSAGKRGSGKTRKGSKWLSQTLVECAKTANPAGRPPISTTATRWCRSVRPDGRGGRGCAAAAGGSGRPVPEGYDGGSGAARACSPAVGGAAKRTAGNPATPLPALKARASPATTCSASGTTCVATSASSSRRRRSTAT